MTSFACMGGGSGGMTSSILRSFPKSTGMFNSQLELTGYHPQGVAPGLPAALDAMPKTVSSRCMNPSTSWEAQTDLLPSPMTHSPWEAPSFSKLSGTGWWGNAVLFISLGHYSRPWRLCFRITQEQTPPNFTFTSQEDDDRLPIGS